jgi:hypothetical protein
MRKIEVKIRQIIWAFKKSFKPTTYDLVIYEGKQYFIKSSLTGENVWNLFEKGEKEPIHRYIKGQDLKVVQSVKRFINVFKKHLTFQKQSWGLIDCGNPIDTRLSYNNSEDIYFRGRSNIATNGCKYEK